LADPGTYEYCISFVNYRPGPLFRLDQVGTGDALPLLECRDTSHLGDIQQHAASNDATR
jgi:hypothetical protein